MGNYSNFTIDQIKNKLWDEVALKAELVVYGVNITKEALSKIKLGTEIQEQVHCLFEMDFEIHDFSLPSDFYLSFGLSVPFMWNSISDYVIAVEKNNFILTKKGHKITEIEFHKRPKYYDKYTSDGTPMSNVGVFYPDGNVFVVYSNECSYKDKGEDCLFCNINYTKDTYAEKEGISWKNPKQIGETVAAAYKEGIANHVTISGGVIPERRELDYYLDAAEAIKEHTGLDDFNGTATVAAPIDLSNIDKFKEVGYSSTAMNLEIWDKNIYSTICPGKSKRSGGWDHWVEALEYAVKVFGYGKVRSTFVVGIEPKKKTIEGFEYLSSKGVVAIGSVWIPNPGSELSGHRTPEPSWHLDLAVRNVAIWKKNGITYDHTYNSNANSDTLQHDIYKIEDELLPVFKRTNLSWK
ncbi:radical SAM protein [Clostridium sp. DJ247]|uniref:radical SAM protein n=1 Tax=Clostridium sp. DJ247 TaxID=2726188 RepID=UPI001F4C57CB|nr:radical SAM protein [Clostridium sp. DJ247]